MNGFKLSIQIMLHSKRRMEAVNLNYTSKLFKTYHATCFGFN